MRNLTLFGLISFRFAPAGRALALLAAIAGCGSAPTPTARPTTASPPEPASACLRRTDGALPAPMGATGSTIALVETKDRVLAYVADADARAVHVVDVASRTELGSTTLSGAPSQLVVARDGRVVVALQDADRVDVLEPGSDPKQSMSSLCSLPVAAEPRAVAFASPDRLLVTSGWGATLAAFEGEGLRPAFRVPLPREPRGMVVSDDGSKAYVAHVVGSKMSVVDLRAPDHRVRSLDVGGVEKDAFARGIVGGLLSGGRRDVDRKACQGFALAKTVEPKGRILAPQVLVDPGDASEPSGGYGSGGFVPVEVANVAVIDEATDGVLPASVEVAARPNVLGSRRSAGECLLPRAAAVDPSSGALLVACQGIDAVVAYDAAAAGPHDAEIARWSVAGGPTGIAVDARHRRAVAWSQFDRELSVFSLQSVGGTPSIAPPAVQRIAMRPLDGSAAQLALGRKLFHSSDNRISSDGRACASCHPDGREDSLTWATPDGPRQTPMLAGRLATTAPYGWNGDNKNVQEHLEHTFQRLGGSGLSKPELDALVAFATQMSVPRETASSATLVAQGRDLFHSETVGCATCHVEGAGTDRVAHDVGSRVKADGKPTFDTPSLRFVGKTAPYFHDGRYTSLRALLTDVDGEMGHTKHLSASDLTALEAYLRSL